MQKHYKIMPVVALRNMTVLPGTLIHFDVNRDFSIKAVEKAMRENKEILLTAQKNNDTEKPTTDDLYSVGCIALVKQLIKLPGNIYRVMVNGLRRGVLNNITTVTPFYEGEVMDIEDAGSEIPNALEKAMLRSLKELLDVYFSENNKINKDIVKQMSSTESLANLVEQASIHIPMSMYEKQSLLEELEFTDLYNRLMQIIANETDVFKLMKDIQTKVKNKVDKNQREYILREQMKVIREELGETSIISDAENYKIELNKIDAQEQVKIKIEKEIERFKNASGGGPESTVIRSYIETLLELPWDKKSIDNYNLSNAKKVLEEDHYGLSKVKERVLEFLAVKTLTSKGDAPIICLLGPPGTGKTSIARSIAKALDKKYVRICLGGVRDEAEIRGHRRTYIGAMPGRLAAGLKNAGVKNPLILLDEVDKVSSDYKGDTSSALLEVLDSEQNNKFVDHYVEIPIDLSEVLFITTANSAQTIPKPLLDRMEIIEVNSYTSIEKYHIAAKHLIDKQLMKNGLNKKQISVSSKAIEKIISGYTREAGVRTLERRIGEIFRKAAKELLEDDKHMEGKKIRITEKNLNKYLGKIKYREDKALKEPSVGIVRGLAWTSTGGDTLEIEVNVMKGKGNIELTGQLGDVMKESAKTAISCIRADSEKHKIPDSYFEEHDIHIHIPEGAVPKDGPSAGITMACAVYSAVTNKPIRADIAMTGEISLRGRVLPIGGLKEKMLAAKAAGIKTVIIPKENNIDVEELDDEVSKDLEIKYVSRLDEVLKAAVVQ